MVTIKKSTVKVHVYRYIRILHQAGVYVHKLIPPGLIENVSRLLQFVFKTISAFYSLKKNSSETCF